MAKPTAYLNENAKQNAIEKLKMAAILQYTMPGVPCVYYGDENGQEGHIDPFCRRCFDWDNLNEDLIGFYKKLGEIRRKFHDIFKDGEFCEIKADGGLIFYRRTKNFNDLYIYANNSSKSFILEIEERYTDCLLDKTYENQIIVEPYSYGILVKSKQI